MENSNFKLHPKRRCECQALTSSFALLGSAYLGNDKAGRPPVFVRPLPARRQAMSMYDVLFGLCFVTLGDWCDADAASSSPKEKEMIYIYTRMRSLRQYIVFMLTEKLTWPHYNCVTRTHTFFYMQCRRRGRRRMKHLFSLSAFAVCFYCFKPRQLVFCNHHFSSFFSWLSSATDLRFLQSFVRKPTFVSPGVAHVLDGIT